MSFGTNTPFGLKPAMIGNASPWSGQVTDYRIDPVNTITLGRYAPVTLANTGYLAAGITGTNAPSLGTLGSLIGVRYYDPTGKLIFSTFWTQGTPIKANTDVQAMVADDPSIVYEVQTNGAPGLTLAMIGNTMNFGGQNAALGFNGSSGVFADQTTIGTESWRNFKLIGLSKSTNPLNVSGANYNVGLFRINNHFFAAGTAGI